MRDTITMITGPSTVMQLTGMAAHHRNAVTSASGIAAVTKNTSKTTMGTNTAARWKGKAAHH